MGVDIFFALSGFLITTLILEEYQGTATIGMRNFYVRRALRLFPALLAVVVVTDVYMAFDSSNPDRGVTLGSTPAVLFYYANWEWFVHGGTALGWFGHCWSLAVEEQFYLFWPPALLWLLKRKWPRERIAVTLALASLVSMFLRTYSDHIQHSGGAAYGTPMVADQLLIGCLVATSLTVPTWRQRIVRLSEACVWLCAAYLVFYFALLGVTTSHPTLLYGPMLTGVAAATAMGIVVLVTNPGHFLTRLLSIRPMVFLGRISYGMYLWHLVVCFALAEKVSFSHQSIYWVSGYGLTVIVAVLSSRFIEAPALRLKQRFEPARAPAQVAAQPLPG
jgi:peptidoglycan/LPS O-acetylase OafA/YrhL